MLASLTPVRSVSRGKKVETEVSTRKSITIHLEVNLQSELPEATLVIRPAIVADSALGSRDRHRYALAYIGDIIQPVLDKEVMVVEKIESLCPALHIDLLMNREDLAHSSIERPRSRSPEAVACSHRRRERAPIRDIASTRRPKQRRISE